MKKNLSLTLFICLLFSSAWLSAQTLVSTMPENKAAILEEFTGVSCPNCPPAHQIIENLLPQYPNNLFVVSYHPTNSSYTTPRNASDPDFRRGFLDGFYTSSFVGSRFMPGGLVNRRIWGTERMTSRGNWTSYINTIQAEASPVNVGTVATYDTATSLLSVDVEVYYTDTSATANTLYVFLLEDSLVADQSGSGGSPNYVHNHVFRETLTTDQWGDLIPLTPVAGQFYKDTLTFDNSAGAYNMKNCSVIAFVRDPSTEEIFSGTSAHVTEFVDNTNIDDDFASQIHMEVYPNPAKHTANVSFTLRNVQELQLELLDLNGKSISGSSLGTFSAGTHQHSLDLTELPAGMYVVKMIADGKVGMKRLFVTK